MTLDSQLPGEIEPNLWWRRSPHFAAVLQVCHRCWHVDQVRRWLVDQVRCWHVDQVHRWHVDHTLWCQWWHRHWRLVPFHANAQYFILLRSSPVLYILSATKCHHCSLEYYQYSLTTDQLNQYLMCNVDQAWLLLVHTYWRGSLVWKSSTIAVFVKEHSQVLSLHISASWRSLGHFQFCSTREPE